VEFTGEELLEPEAAQRLLSSAAAEAIMRDLPICQIGDALTNRTIEIAGFLPMPCGGTHVSHLSLLGKVELVHVKIKRGRLRVSYRVSEPAGA
jgi:alanyl-tRNA synthetase